MKTINEAQGGGGMSYHEEDLGNREGETCNRNGCKGVIMDRIESCSCHLCPPCSKCVGDTCFCPECGWEVEA